MRRSRHWCRAMQVSFSAMLSQTACLGMKCHSLRSLSRNASAGAKGFIQRGGMVRVQVLLHHHDLPGLGIHFVAERLGGLGPVARGAPSCHVRAVPLILLRFARHSGGLRLAISALVRSRCARAGIDFHRANEGLAVLRRQAPLLGAPGFQRDIICALPTVCSLMDFHQLQAHQMIAQQPQRAARGSSGRRRVCTPQPCLLR